MWTDDGLRDDDAPPSKSLTHLEEVVGQVCLLVAPVLLLQHELVQAAQDQLHLGDKLEKLHFIFRCKASL